MSNLDFNSVSTFFEFNTYYNIFLYYVFPIVLIVLLSFVVVFLILINVKLTNFFNKQLIFCLIF